MNSLHNTFIISVESRKGGVGKTTAALCLGKLLLQKGLEVLLLDTDITGTNVVDALDSAFWRDSTHVVPGIEGREKGANLLELFERGFMAGKGSPDFGRPHQSKKQALVWNEGKINVIGSAIYSSEGGKLICKPSILFDELHAFWFAKYLGEICVRFQEAVGKQKRTAIVIDNSPGYVGIGPTIQEWLIDGGVDINKFLFVSSLDAQDLAACLKGMDALHSTYTGKWRVAKELAEQRNSKTGRTKKSRPEWDGDEMRFVLRLLENGATDLMNGELGFYLNRGFKPYLNEKGQLGDAFEEKVEKYQGIVVNRVPRRFKKGWWVYRIDSDKEKDSKVRKLLRDEEHWGEVSTEIMIEYNEYIESQFGVQAVHREQKWARHPEELEWILDPARTAVESLRERRHTERGELVEFWKRLNDYQTIIDDLLVRLAGEPMYALRDLIKDEWQPKAIAADFQRGVLRIWQHEWPPFRKWIRSEDIEHRIHEMERIQKIVRMEIEEYFHNKKLKRDILIYEPIIFSGSAALIMALQNLTENTFEEATHELGRTVGVICSLEVEYWMRERNSKKSIAMFLAQEKFSDEKWLWKTDRIHPNLPSVEHKSEIRGLYESFAKTQARILDLDQDVEFLISMITQVVRDEMRDEKSGEGLLPYIGGVADKVIVDKKISHEEGMEECSKGFRIAESLGQFEEILSNTLTRWEIE